MLKQENGQWYLYEAERYILASQNIEIVQGEAGYTICTEFSNIEKDSYIEVKTDDKGCRYIIMSNDRKLRWGDQVSFSVYESLDGKNLTHCKNGRRVWDGIVKDISKVDGQDQKYEKEKTGYVYIGEMSAMAKHGESVFRCINKLEDIDTEELEQAFNDLLETLEIYRDTAINKTKGHSGYLAFDEVRNLDAIPLWYKLIDGKVSLSFASIGRVMYNTSLNELVGNKKPCENKKNLCEACALFGMAGQEEKFGSRIRFTDAKQIGKCKTKKEVILKVLGQPRYSYLPFYAKGSVKSYDDSGAEISGRKFYWHNLRAATDESVYKTTEQGKLNSTMELVLPNKNKPLFAFTVYYDGITEEQLKKLTWCINLGENKEDGMMAHKIGHGKPLGLGSVKFVITEQRKRSFKNGKYWWEDIDISTEVGNPGLKNYQNLMKIMNIEEPLKGQKKETPNQEILPIEYPDIRDMNGKRFPEKRERNEDARHNWYSQNKNQNNKNIMKLPEPLTENQALCIFQKELKEQSDQSAKWKKGQVYSAKVMDFNPQKTVAYIKLEKNIKGRIFFKDVKGAEYGKIDNVLCKGKEIKVVFKEQKDQYFNFYLKEN